ncbi:MAG: hypothetical protein HUU38_31520, partial [Anaerolineales bacterium]|nr:hypothetical protein [Anaerolineales bacterium]
MLTTPFILSQEDEDSGEISASIPKLLRVNEATMVGELPTHAFIVTPTTLTISIDKTLRHTSSLPGVIIQCETGTIDVISRRKFYEILGRRYGVALYMNRPIGTMLELAGIPPTIVPADHSIGDTVALALSRPADLVYEPILLRFKNKTYRLLDVYTLILAQSMLLANLQTQLREINRHLEQRVAARTEELETRLEYEQAVVLCANTLLQVTDHEGAIPETLQHLRQAAEVSRVFLAENVDVENIGPALSLQYQAHAPETPPFPDVLNILPHRLLGRWANELWLGNAVTGRMDELELRYRQLFEQAGIASILLLPYGEPGAWEGVIGFSEHTDQRVWDEHDVRLLQTVAQMIYTYLVRKRNAQELSATRDQALRANQFKSELLAKVSHELRTPLGAILGYSQLLQFGSYGLLNEDQKHAAELVIGSTKYLNNLVNSLLDQAQLESGKLKILPSPFDIHQMVHEVDGRVRILAEEKGLDFQVRIEPMMPDLLCGDLTRLQQVITNLLGNAIKFTDTGQVSLRVGLLDSDEWYLQVSDTGPGIPFEDQERIFEPFRQVDGSPTRRHTGTGLGLSISNQLIQMMDGIILLESSPGKGSTFTVH